MSADRLPVVPDWLEDDDEFRGIVHYIQHGKIVCGFGYSGFVGAHTPDKCTSDEERVSCLTCMRALS